MLHRSVAWVVFECARGLGGQVLRHGCPGQRALGIFELGGIRAGIHNLDRVGRRDTNWLGITNDRTHLFMLWHSIYLLDRSS